VGLLPVKSYGQKVNPRNYHHKIKEEKCKKKHVFFPAMGDMDAVDW
jgi:hypothetical protein